MTRSVVRRRQHYDGVGPRGSLWAGGRVVHARTHARRERQAEGGRGRQREAEGGGRPSSCCWMMMDGRGGRTSRTRRREWGRPTLFTPSVPQQQPIDTAPSSLYLLTFFSYFCCCFVLLTILRIFLISYYYGREEVCIDDRSGGDGRSTIYIGGREVPISVRHVDTLPVGKRSWLHQRRLVACEVGAACR
eukprot:GHVU01054860.1.p1 GENE.GHVU01054860.1~~GHVU01054860.1.p1  ORF type:complete len:190 (-),score=8.05 GHVU01054860.1:1117-1686(-)